MCCRADRSKPKRALAPPRQGSEIILPGSAAIGSVIYIVLLSALDIKTKRRRIVYHTMEKARKSLPTLRLMSRQLVGDSVNQIHRIPRRPLRVLRSEWRVSDTLAAG